MVSRQNAFVYDEGASGRCHDKETGTFYNYFRDHYFAELGRYGQSDPIGLRGGLNTFTYALSNPLKWVDPLGLFSPGAHDAIIDSAFNTRLTPPEIRVIQQASRDFDTRTQSSSESNLHSMRLRGQSIADAEAGRDRFIRQALGEARAMNQRGDRAGALRRLGEACHPIMDWSSSEHSDGQGQPKEWNPLWPFGHSPNDSMGNETVHDLTPNILDTQGWLLNGAYDSVFGK
ncbi:MAG: RHS repeat-associated core domain-containing protein [Gallionella sp.]|nr:RHS repeat-associated core domain-containing protein [Gallionella sp.]